jgi:hypothetical protein
MSNDKEVQPLRVRSHSIGWQLGSTVFVGKGSGADIMPFAQEKLGVATVTAYRATVSKFVAIRAENGGVTCVQCKPEIEKICQNVPPYGLNDNLPPSVTTVFVNTTALATPPLYGDAETAMADASKGAALNQGFWLFEVENQPKPFFFLAVAGK